MIQERIHDRFSGLHVHLGLGQFPGAALNNQNNNVTYYQYLEILTNHFS